MKSYKLDLEEEFHTKLKIASAAQGKSMKDFIIEAIQEKIEGDKDELPRD